MYQHTNILLIVWPDGQPHQAKQHDLHSQGVFWRRPRWCWVFWIFLVNLDATFWLVHQDFAFGSFWLVQVGYYMLQFVLIVYIIHHLIYINIQTKKRANHFETLHPGKTTHFSGVFLCSDAASLEVGEFPVWPGPDPTENGGSLEQKRRVVEGWWPEYIPKPFEGNGSPEKWWLEDKLGEKSPPFLGDFQVKQLSNFRGSAHSKQSTGFSWTNSPRKSNNKSSWKTMVGWQAFPLGAQQNFQGELVGSKHMCKYQKSAK